MINKKKEKLYPSKSIRIDDETWFKARRIALERRITMGELFREMLKSYEKPKK